MKELGEVLDELAGKEPPDLSVMSTGELITYGNDIKRQRDAAKSTEGEIKSEMHRVDRFVLERFNSDTISSMSGGGMTTYLAHQVGVVVTDLVALKQFALDHDEGLHALLTFNSRSLSAHVKKAYLEHPDLKDQYFTDKSKLPEGLRDCVRISEATVVRRKKA